MTWFQKSTDKFLDQTLLPFIPAQVSPNQVSWLRIVSLPFIYYCLFAHFYITGFALFIIAALSDAVDGALARTRNQITETGKVLDAAADRGLIAVVALVFIPSLFGWTLIFVGAALEVVNGIMAYRSKQNLGQNPGANGAGKIKMIVQCVAFGAIFAYFVGGSASFLKIAYDLFLVSLVFTVIQAFMYP